MTAPPRCRVYRWRLPSTEPLPVALSPALAGMLPVPKGGSAVPCFASSLSYVIDFILKVDPWLKRKSVVY